MPAILQRRTRGPLPVRATCPAAAVLPDYEHLDVVASRAENRTGTPARRSGPQGDGWPSRSLNHSRRPPGRRPPHPRRADARWPEGGEATAPSVGAAHRRWKQHAAHSSPAMKTAISDSTCCCRRAVGAPALFHIRPATMAGSTSPAYPRSFLSVGQSGAQTRRTRSPAAPRRRDPPGAHGSRRITRRIGPLPRHHSRAPDREARASSISPSRATGTMNTGNENVL